MTVPLELEGNRPFIDLDLARPGESAIPARFWIDTGGGGFLLTEPLARRMGVTWGETMREDGAELGRATDLPEASVAGFPIRLDPERVFVTVGKDNLLPLVAPGHADGLLPGHVLAQYHVVFDYLNGTFTLAEPGAATSAGVALPMSVAAHSGFPRIELVIDGTTHGFLLDTGASFTMVSEVVLKQWGSAHPEWERHEGAVGDAVTLGGATLETMIVPFATWGPCEVAGMGVVSQPEGAFEQWMSSMMTAPIVGAVAGNVLKQFRLELDYANQTVYIARAPSDRGGKP